MIQWLIRTACPEPVASPEPVPPDVVVRRASWLPALAGLLAGMGGPAAAVTLGRTIVVHPSVKVSSRLVKHELAHVQQWQEHPLAFPVRYVLNHLRFGYTDNPFEVEARNAEAGDQ
jgi:hypothetical protein